jgi:hypothetical protein
MILGAGWPFHLGGITPYLDRTGIAAKVNGAPFRGSNVSSGLQPRQLGKNVVILLRHGLRE